MICKLRSTIRHPHSMDTQVESVSWMKDIQDIGQSIKTPNLILGTLIGHIYIKNSKLSISANNLNSYSPIKFQISPADHTSCGRVWQHHQIPPRTTLELRSEVDSPTPWKSLCKQFVFSRSCLDRNVSWAHNLLQDAKSLSIKRDNINTHLSHRVMYTPLKAAGLCCRCTPILPVAVTPLPLLFLLVYFEAYEPQNSGEHKYISFTSSHLAVTWNDANHLWVVSIFRHVTDLPSFSVR